MRGESCHLIGKDGQRYLDFASGIAVNALSHGHPRLVKAIADQAARLISSATGSEQSLFDR